MSVTMEENEWLVQARRLSEVFMFLVTKLPQSLQQQDIFKRTTEVMEEFMTTCETDCHFGGLENEIAESAAEKQQAELETEGIVDSKEMKEIRWFKDKDEDFETEKCGDNLSESCIIDSEDVKVDESQDEMLEEGELRQIKDEKDENTQLHGNIIFRCIFCTNIEFSTLEQLNSHDEEFHKKGDAYSCIDECYFTSREKKQIVDHFAQNHVKDYISNKNKHLYYCIFCDIGFEAEDEQKKHEQGDHFDGEKYSCPKCDFHEALRNKVMDHFADEHKPLVRHRSTGGMFKQQLFYCSKCSQAFYTSSRLRKHLSVVHSIDVNSNTCLLCLEVFETNWKRKHHEDTHNKSGFRCIFGQCRNITFFESIELLRAHQNDAQAHPALVSKICHICDKEFTENSVYVKHMKSHNVKLEKNFGCNNCEKKFFHPSELKLHVRQKHTKRFRCTKCDFGTYTKRTLERHMLVHMEKSSFTIMCQICGMVFKHDDYLVRHMASHSDARPYTCSTCGKAFKMRKHLTIHKKIHTKEYSITCDICDRPFVQRYNLKQHMKKHHPDA